MAPKKSAEARYNAVPIDQVPEVAAYEEVKARYEQFKRDNPEFFKYLQQLEDELNTALQAADQAVRTRQVSCGDWHFYQKQTKLNADMTYQIHGHERFLMLGGSLETITKKSLNKERYLVNVKSGAVTPEEAAAVVSEEPRYHKPEGIKIQ